MQVQKTSQQILVGITTYAGDFEARLILRKTLRHLRAKNGNGVFLLVISDGKILDPQVHLIADAVLDRQGPCGLHQGELDSIWQLVDFAQKQGFSRLIKSAGDIIMTEPDWAKVVMNRFQQTGAKIMSTHWFDDNSWIVGTKFFAADTEFLAQTLPKTVEQSNLEEAFTAGIAAHYSVQEVAYLINTNTGERHEVKYELKNWGWEHGHRLTKFVCLDEAASTMDRWLGKLVVYPALRVKRDIMRSINKWRR